MRLPTPTIPSARDLAIGACAAALAVLLQLALLPWLGGRVPFLFVVPTLIFTAATAGRLAGALVLLAGAASACLSFEPHWSWVIRNPADRLALMAYLAVGTLLVVYGGRLRLRSARALQIETRLNLAQDQTGIGLFELDYSADTAYASPAMCQMLGQPVMRGSMPLAQWLAALHAGHVEDSRRTLQRKVAEGILRYEREHQVRLPDGSTRWLLTRVQLELDARGTLALARGAALDVSDRHELTQVLERTQAQLQLQLDDLSRLHALSDRLLAIPYLERALQAILEAVVSFHEAAAGGVLWLCDEHGAARAAARCGCVDQALIDSWGEAAAHPVLAAASSAGRQAVWADVVSEPRFGPWRAVLAEHSVAGLLSTPLCSGDESGDRLIGVLTVAVTAAQRPDDRVLRLTDLCATQATALIERERALALARATQDRFEVALQSASVAFTIMAAVRDASGHLLDLRWTYVNPAAAAFLGHSVEAMTGQNVLSLLPKAWEEPGMLQRYGAVIATRQPDDLDLRVQREGRSFWLHLIISPLGDSVVLWFADVTERHEQEQALQEADKRKDEFLATLAHELRNPLAPIRQAAAIARSTNVTEAQRLWSHEVIERQLGHMAMLLDDLLDISRITSGTFTLRRERCRLKAIADAALETARPLIDARQHQLVVQLPSHDVWLDADLLRLSQVLANLLVNAAKYTDRGGRITLAAAEAGNELVVTVEDNGMGLPHEDLERVFEMFTQASGRASEARAGGLGIGLALSRGLVQLHGGSVRASSPGPGCGSTFTVRLPAAGDAPGTAAALPPEAAASPAIAPRRIMIADDNQDAAHTLGLLLGLDGHEVKVTHDGREALACYRDFQPQWAFLDLDMPEHDGLEVARIIRATQPRGQGIVLVAITGWGQQRDRARALAAGFDHHLTKPVDPQRLQALLNAITQPPAGSPLHLQPPMPER